MVSWLLSLKILKFFFQEIETKKPWSEKIYGRWMIDYVKKFVEYKNLPSDLWKDWINSTSKVERKNFFMALKSFKRVVKVRPVQLVSECGN